MKILTDVNNTYGEITTQRIVLLDDSNVLENKSGVKFNLPSKSGTLITESDVACRLSTKVDNSTFDNYTKSICTELNVVGTCIQTLASSIADNSSAIELLESTDESFCARIFKNENSISTINETLKSHTCSISTHGTKICTLETSNSGKADKATTLSGYGITDAYTKTQIDSKLEGYATDTEYCSLYNKICTNTSNISKNASTISTLSGCLTALETSNAGKANKSTTLSGYGITNAYTKDEIDTTLGGYTTDSEYCELYSKVDQNSIGICSLGSNLSTLTTTVNGKANKATTLSGYGITDAYTKSCIDNILDGYVNVTDYCEFKDDISSKVCTLETTVGTHSTCISTLGSNLSTLTTTVNGKANKATTLAGYGITNAYTKTEVDGLVSKVYKYKGSVASYSNLPTSGLTIGDVYNVEDTGDNYAWTGTEWDNLAGFVNLTDFYDKEEIDNALLGYVKTSTTVNGKALTGNISLTKSDVGLSNVNNTSDASKPVSTATQNALNLKANSADVYTKTAADGLFATIACLNSVVSDVSTNATNISNNAEDIETLSGCISALETSNAGKANKATTLAGYGITDAYTKTQIDDTLLTKSDFDTYCAAFCGEIEDINSSISTLSGCVTALETSNAGKANKATTLSGYGITDAYTKTNIDNKLDSYVLKTTTVNGHALSSNITITKSDVGLCYVNNTSDADKPISTATQNALDLKANSSSVYTKTAADGKFALITTTTAISGCVSALEEEVAGKADSATTLAGYGITNAYTKTEVDTTLEDYVLTSTTINSKALTGNISLTKSDIGLGNVNNTSDAAKPISTATQNALNLKANSADVYTKTAADELFATIETTDTISGCLTALETSNAGKANKSTSLSGYGITNAYTKTEVDTKLAGYATDEEYCALYNKICTNATNISTNTSCISTLSTNLSTLTTTVNGKANKATTLSGYGITDAYTKTEVTNTLKGYTTDSEYCSLYDIVEQNSTGICTLTSDLSALTNVVEGKANSATTLAGYGITNAYTKSEIDTKLGSVYKYIGSVSSYSNLPTTGLVAGYVYNVTDTGDNYAWTGTEWDKLGGTIDLSPYAKSADVGKLASPNSWSGNNTFSGTVTLGSKAVATTQASTDNDTSVATTAFVHTVSAAKITSLKSAANSWTGNNTFSGTVTLGSKAVATTPAITDNDTSVATTAFVHSLVNDGNYASLDADSNSWCGTADFCNIVTFHDNVNFCGEVEMASLTVETLELGCLCVAGSTNYTELPTYNGDVGDITSNDQFVTKEYVDNAVVKYVTQSLPAITVSSGIAKWTVTLSGATKLLSVLMMDSDGNVVYPQYNWTSGSLNISINSSEASIAAGTYSITAAYQK